MPKLPNAHYRWVCLTGALVFTGLTVTTHPYVLGLALDLCAGLRPGWR